MALAPGTKLGPNEILAPLGAGGMGEVFRARDTRLGKGILILGDNGADKGPEGRDGLKRPVSHVGASGSAARGIRENREPGRLQRAERGPGWRGEPMPGWSKMRRRTRSSVMKATTRITPWQRGQTSGSTSYTRQTS